MDYRTEIYELAKTFGLEIDYDQLDVAGKEWIRLRCDWYDSQKKYPEVGSLIIYKGDLEDMKVVTNQDWKKFICDEMQYYIFRLGEHSMKVKINELLRLDK